MPDYSQGKIYRIRSKNCPEVYVGSTIQNLVIRFNRHKRDYINYILGNTVNYISSFEICSNEECYIELIELFPCESWKQLEEREGYWIRQEECCVNIKGTKLPEQKRQRNNEATRKWREANKERKKIINQKWKEANRDYVIERDRKYREMKKQSAVIQAK
jgi:hypothetical protein